MLCGLLSEADGMPLHGMISTHDICVFQRHLDTLMMDPTYEAILTMVVKPAPAYYFLSVIDGVMTHINDTANILLQAQHHIRVARGSFRSRTELATPPTGKSG